MSEFAELIVAIVGTSGLGAAAKWVWVKLEKRFTDIEADLKECKERELHAAERRETWRATMELLWAELKRTSPKSPILARAKKLMDELKDDPPH